MAVAESCTGGLLTSRLTDVPGSSAYVERGVVCYSNRSKVELLGVPDAILSEHGAVSEPVAQAMAEGARARAGTDVGIGITGIAGPDGGTPDKPVGTVAIAVVVGGETRVRTFQFVGGREQVKFQASQAALNMLRLMLDGQDRPYTCWNEPGVSDGLRPSLHVLTSQVGTAFSRSAETPCVCSWPSIWTTTRARRLPGCSSAS